MPTNNGKNLTPRERECLSLVAQHLRTKQIARMLGTSPHTVDRQIALACRKLGAPDRLTAVQMLLQSGELDSMLDNPLAGSSGMVTDAVVGPDEGATESSNDTTRKHNNPDLQLARTGDAIERPRRRTGPEGNDSLPGIGDQKAEAVSDTGDASPGNPVSDGLRGRRPVPTGDGLRITRFGYVARLGIIALIAVVSALLISGVLVAADAALESFHRVIHL